MRLLDQNEEFLHSGFVYYTCIQDRGDVSSRESKTIRHFIRASRGADAPDAYQCLLNQASLIQTVIN
ncbi:hypothetical protein [Pseudomonas fulva]|uniref:hypothetical protein n=1 Tax=Pseudomonas fulva TaxID=47880 RepID=UPI003D2F518E